MKHPHLNRFLKVLPLAALLFGALPATAADSPAPIPLTKIVPDGKPHKFEARDHQFFIDGQPTMLLSGEMHFGRVQPEDWDTRIKQAKAMGLNTISFYLFWNMVEPQEGQFNFTGMTDLRRVLKLCQDNGMWCVLRPGPYCCAEIEYGGIPYWTLKYPNVKIRTDDPQWLSWCRRYLGEVYKQVADLQVGKGGPLLMVQVDNEYGITDPQTYPGNNNYIVALAKIFKDVGFETQLFTCDPTQAPEWTDPSFRIPGIMICRNGLSKDSMYEQSKDAIGDWPVFVPEVYPAWFLGWGDGITKEYHDKAQIPAIVNWTAYLLDHHYSFNYYVFFGGTNYGFDNGSLFFDAVQTSYDYSAPIDEAGRTTEKYKALRDLISQRTGVTPPAPPPEPNVISIPPIRFTEHEPLLATLPARPTRTAAKPVAMEDLGQAYGFVDYRKVFPNGVKGTLELHDAMDYALILLNGYTVDKAFKGYGPDSNKVTLNESGPVTLDILVYNLGRISVVTSYRTQQFARKGLLGGATLDGKELTGWDMYSLPYTDGVEKFSPAATPQSGPAFYHATFNLDQLGGTFLDMRHWSFGVVWVNGHNLGRFWDRGPVRSLFVPEEWLKRGENDIVVLELHDAPRRPEVSGGTQLLMDDKPVPFAVKLSADPLARK
ncbi:MAG TPA: beta-galactosidase [Opitutales bacterium]|nr:beta-galactosidase [Opitutales bacterium]